MTQLSTVVALVSALATMPAAVPASQASGTSVATVSAAATCVTPAHRTRIEAAGRNPNADADSLFNVDRVIDSISHPLP